MMNVLRNRDGRRFRAGAYANTLAMFWILLGCSSLLAQQAKPTEYDVEAAYLSNFGKFVQWPPGAPAEGHSFSVCVLGKDPFGPALDSALAASAIDGKTPVGRRISKPDQALSCRIVFISSSEGSRVKEVLKALGNADVLTVSDIPQFSRLGGMIEFVLDGSRVRFEVNLAAAENTGLMLSSELLRVATAVRKDAPSGG